ncbi:MAG TPA: DinB family protein [Bryobacteraceae bacterium]|nr:DinB family protein [Bryobacteraceae bacterium]
MNLTVTELLKYTDEEREKWEQWFRENGEDVLRMPIGGDRETTVGALILHIFGPEQRYIQRLRNQQLSEYRARPSDRVDAVFGYGLETRKLMRDYVARAKPEEWERVIEFEVSGRKYRATARKVVLHALLHEIRHWAQIARLVRDRGFAPPGDHDLLSSSALL